MKIKKIGEINWKYLMKIGLFMETFLFLITLSLPAHQNTTEFIQTENKMLSGSDAANQGEELEVKSRITSVMVYPDKAQIFRKAQISLLPTIKSLVFPSLPAVMVPGSVRVTGSGSAHVKILGVEVKTNYLEAEQLPEVKKLRQEIKTTEAEIAGLKGQLSILDSQEKFLNSFGESISNQTVKELVAGRADFMSADKFLDFLSSKLQVIQKRRLETNQLLEGKKAVLEALNNRLKEIMPAKSKEEKTVRVLLEVAEPGTLEMELSYVVGQVHWEPVYTIRALPESGEVELNLTALVSQKTGENWEAIRLSFSTSSPTAGNRPGELEPWYLDLAQPRLLKSLAREEVEKRGIEESIAVASAPVEEAPAEVSTGWWSANFEIKKPWTVLSDGTERRVPIDSQKLSAVFDYLSIPKLQELAYLRGRIKNTLSYPLLPGRADLFINQDIIGSTSLEFVPINDEVSLFFGEDPEIKVKREMVMRERSGPGFMGKTDKIHYIYKISLENFRNREAEIELRDQIPVSQNSRIEVKDVKITPNPSSRDEKGILTWNIKLRPKEKQEFNLDFTIEYPKGARIAGL
ncbi:MAG: mucoidy inhibitor MuiA family protein [Candidatus Aminicenantes bacterium]|nr:mucoidy inhibitor MuiA family protein [Candidatus Aminicenantes bacterium]